MKKTALLIVIFIAIHAKAQSPVIDLQAWRGQIIPDMYLKDVNNVLDPFVGTWLYTNGTTSFKIVLVKKTMRLLATYYEDLLIGEHQYIDNGVEKFNSLDNLNSLDPNEYNHKIVGNHIPYFHTPFDEEIPGEIRLDLYFEDNDGGSIQVRKKMVGVQQAIQIFRSEGHAPYVAGAPVIVPIVPPGVIFTLIKQ